MKTVERLSTKNKWLLIIKVRIRCLSRLPELPAAETEVASSAGNGTLLMDFTERQKDGF